MYLRFLKYIAAIITLASLLPGSHAAGLSAQAQSRSTVFGRVTDAESRAPLENVNVFLSSTTIGTATGPNGTYRLTNIPIGVFQLVCSRVGHTLESTPLNVLKPETLRVDFALTPRTLQRDEIEVVAREPGEWKRLLPYFMHAFLGETENAPQCTILNPEVVDLQMNPGTTFLRASTDSVVRIDNHALGYRVYARIGMFEWNTAEDVGKYLLYTRFEPLPARSSAELQAWEENRTRTYLGSLRHFLASLVAGTLEREGFAFHWGSLATLKEGSYAPPEPGDFVLARVPGQSVFKISLKKWLRVEFRGERIKTTSFLTLKNEYAIVDAVGNLVDPSCVSIFGHWAQSRVADLLPFSSPENFNE